jgi:hypothetical protein
MRGKSQKDPGNGIRIKGKAAWSKKRARSRGTKRAEDIDDSAQSRPALRTIAIGAFRGRRCWGWLLIPPNYSNKRTFNNQVQGARQSWTRMTSASGSWRRARARLDGAPDSYISMLGVHEVALRMDGRARQRILFRPAATASSAFQSKHFREYWANSRCFVHI